MQLCRMCMLVGDYWQVQRNETPTSADSLLVCMHTRVLSSYSPFFLHTRYYEPNRTVCMHARVLSSDSLFLLHMRYCEPNPPRSRLVQHTRPRHHRAHVFSRFTCEKVEERCVKHKAHVVLQSRSPTHNTPRDLTHFCRFASATLSTSARCRSPSWQRWMRCTERSLRPLQAKSRTGPTTQRLSTTPGRGRGTAHALYTGITSPCCAAERYCKPLHSAGSLLLCPFLPLRELLLQPSAPSFFLTLPRCALSSLPNISPPCKKQIGFDPSHLQPFIPLVSPDSVYPAYTLQEYAQRHPKFWLNTDEKVAALKPGDKLEVIFV